MRVLSALRQHLRGKRLRGDPYDDWRYRWGGGIHKRPDGTWWRSLGYDRFNDEEITERLRRWTPWGLGRWLIFEWWIRRWY